MTLTPTSLHDTVRPIGEFIISQDQVPATTLVKVVADRFFNSPDLDALAVIENAIPKGLITRTKLLLTLSRRFGNELYGRHPIIDIADARPLVVNESELLDTVINKAFMRPAEDIYDEIIVTRDDGSYLGLLSVKQLVLQQSNALTQSILFEEMANERARELERVNQVKSQFLANVTHELRSPVNAIVGLAELLQMAVESGSMEQVQERLSFMMASATNLRAVITNILDLSKIESGKMDVALQEVEVPPMLDQIAETTRILVGSKPVAVRVSMPDDTAMITTDPIKLRQILTNLTSNAAKFTNQGAIDISFSQTGARAEIRVSDTGIGIRQEDLQHIFTAFGQVEDASTKSHEGTGLGLTISRNLARIIGGEISVSSTYGKGSVFSLSLPLQQDQR